MSQQAVHWHEGMFLRPHHFQAQGRHVLDQMGQQVRWVCHHAWGVRVLDLDPDALKNFRFVVRRLEARLRDGTVVRARGGSLPPLDLRRELAQQSSVQILLAVPAVVLGRPNTAAGPDDTDRSRYRVEKGQLVDENDGGNPRPMQFREINLRLKTDREDLAGFETLPIAQVERSGSAEAVPQLAPEFIPPLLACDAWESLQHGILQQLYERVGKALKQRMQRVIGSGVTFDSAAQGDRQIFEGLRLLGEAYSLLNVLSHAEGVHPFPAYLELARLVGMFAILGLPQAAAIAANEGGELDTSRLFPELPPYDHDDLGTCFYRAKKHIDALLDVGAEASGCKERVFLGSGYSMQVTLDAEWLAPAWQLYIGVKTPASLSTSDCINLLSGRLNMKVGSSQRVEEIFLMGRRGLRFDHVARPPRALPTQPGLTYFQVSRDSSEWANVAATLQLAVRLNETLIAGNIQGQRKLVIRHDTLRTEMEFTLYVVPPTLAG